MEIEAKQRFIKELQGKLAKKETELEQKKDDYKKCAVVLIGPMEYVLWIFELRPWISEVFAEIDKKNGDYKKFAVVLTYFVRILLKDGLVGEGEHLMSADFRR